jgi:hypothetical protein
VKKPWVIWSKPAPEKNGWLKWGPRRWKRYATRERAEEALRVLQTKDRFFVYWLEEESKGRQS